MRDNFSFDDKAFTSYPALLALTARALAALAALPARRPRHWRSWRTTSWPSTSSSIPTTAPMPSRWPTR